MKLAVFTIFSQHQFRLSLIYFNGGSDLTVHLSKVAQAGGEVIKEKTSIGPHGFFALFKDTEGNVAALHSPH